MDPNQALLVTATAAAISAAVTILLLLETRASRIASRDTANLVARLGFSDDRQIYDYLFLENLGPAVAREVHMTIEYIDAADAIVKSSGQISAALMAPGPGDRAVFMPSLLLERDRRDPVPDIEDLATQGLSVRIKLDWVDQRTWFPLWFVSRRNRTTTTIDLREYVRSNLKALRILDSTLLSELHDTRRMLERQNFERAARDRMDNDAFPPDIQARVEAQHLSKAVDLWEARARYWFNRLMRRGLH